MRMSQNNLIWLDLEMTGLDPDKDRILEIATIVTDKHLNIMAEGPVIAIHHSDKVLAKMDEWCVNQHGSSGLTDRVRRSKISTRKAEELTLQFLQEYVPEGKSPMCGNTICQDRRFLYRYMPKLEKYFHYRNFDVSVLKIIARRWYPHLAKGLQRKTKHQALSDVYDSIDEMKYYIKNLFILPL
ncbi:MAG: oligoribonuclease [Coxiellaceae bacterium]|jgi:oligoribonuclease|nr:oligoribonuclease [Coxiellaceae bacterium]